MAGEAPSSVRVARAARLPDPVRLERYRHAPEIGVRPLFFSGGTALRGVSRRLVEYTHHSIHLITPFDSGGSSAVLRRSFRMPAVGDLRNRLMALADQSVLGNPEIYRLFAHRLPHDVSDTESRRILDAMVLGREPLVSAVPEPLRDIVRSYLRSFADRMPGRFDLRGAAVGNLVLAGGYLDHGRRLDPVLYLFSRLVQVRGIVRPVVEGNLHLVAELEDGQWVSGQHVIARGPAAGDAPIRRLLLSKSAKRVDEARPPISDSVRDLIGSADLICYPMGSFFTSLLAALLPAGVTDAVAATDVPKVYVPNAGADPESAGLDLVTRVRCLLRSLRGGSERRVTTDELLHMVLVDREMIRLTRADRRALAKLGVECVNVRLRGGEDRERYDPERLAEALLSLI